MLTVLLSFVLFRADTLAGAGLIYRQMLTGFTFTPQSGALLRTLLTPLNMAALGACLVCCLPVVPAVKARAKRRGPWEGFSYACALGLLLLCVLNLSGSAFNPFIYFRF